MLFNSYIFVFLFLPVCLAGYHLLNHFHFYKTGLLFLLILSLWFYGYFCPQYLFIIAGSILFNYTAYRMMAFWARGGYF